MRALLSRMGENTHWRSCATAVLYVITMMEPIALKDDMELVDSIIEKFVALTDTRKHSANLTTSAAIGLSVLMKMIISNHIPLSDSSSKLLTSEEAARLILGSEVPMNLLFTKNPQPTDLMYKTITEVIRLNKTWSTTQTLKIWNSLSVHSCSLIQTHMQLIYKRAGGEHT